MRSAVEDCFGLFNEFLLSIGNLVVEISGNRNAGKLGDSICRDAVRLNCENPVIDAERLLFLFSLLNQVIQLGFLSGVSCAPSLILEENDLIKALVGREFSVEFLEISLLVLEDVQESFEVLDFPSLFVERSAQFFPPPIFCEDSKHSSDDVSDVAASSYVRRQGSVHDNHHHCSQVVADDIEVFYWNY